MNRKIQKVILGISAGVMCAPILFTVIWSFATMDEIDVCFPAILERLGKNIWIWIVPLHYCIDGYTRLLFDTPDFYIVFRNSCIQTGAIVIGQLIFAAPAAYAFSRFKFRGRKILFNLYMLLMLLPFQVTMVSNYFVLQKCHLLDTQLSVIFPGIFSTLPVFIMKRFFDDISKDVYEAAMIDGANDFYAFYYIALPLGKAGVISALMLGFLESWNAIEQPLTFLKDKSLWPLALYLPEMTLDTIQTGLCASIIMLMPLVFLFLWGQESIEAEITLSELKD